MADKTDGSWQPAEQASASWPGPGQEAGEWGQAGQEAVDWGEAGAWGRPPADVPNRLAILVAGNGGYLLAANTTTPAAAPAPDSTATAPADTATPATGTPAAGGTGMPAESATGYSNNQLATSIAQQTGTQLAADSPMYVPISEAQAMASAVPPGAREAGNTITFTSSRVSFTVAAVPPGGPDMTFRIGGMVNPALIIPARATVTVEFINADTDRAHGWEVTSIGPPFPFHIGQPALPEAFARALGDPTGAGDGAETITFTAGPGGRYQYVCPMPGHAQMGMHGSLTVS